MTIAPHDQTPEYTVLIDKTSVGQGVIVPGIRYSLDRAEDDLAILQRVEPYPLTLAMREDESQPWQELPQPDFFTHGED